MNDDTILYLLLGAVGLVILIIMVVGMAQFIHEFARELRYLNYEIQRTHGAERRSWIRKRRRLWWSLIPFVKY